MSHIRITRGKGQDFKRLAQYGKVEAVADDGTTVDLSEVVTVTQIDLRPGEIDKAVITFLAFEVVE